MTFKYSNQLLEIIICKILIIKAEKYRTASNSLLWYRTYMQCQIITKISELLGFKLLLFGYLRHIGCYAEY